MSKAEAESIEHADPTLGSIETTAGGTVEQQNELRRDFKARHVSMIAVSGALATGLVIGTGTALVRGGPANLLISYCVIGLVVFFVMTGMSEMSTILPIDNGFGGYATRFVDPVLRYIYLVLTSVIGMLIPSGLPRDGTISSSMR